MNGDKHEEAHDEGDIALMKRLRMTEAINSFVHSVETRDLDSYSLEFNVRTVAHLQMTVMCPL